MAKNETKQDHEETAISMAKNETFDHEETAISMAKNETKQDPILTVPSKTLSDILVTSANAKNIRNQYPSAYIIRDEKQPPDMIVSDWMYLGNFGHARSKHIVKKLGITHILNCTERIECYHIMDKKIKYARIALDDMMTVNLYDYMEAACSFIDQCNPFYNNNNNNKKRKILIHCAAGVSRSSSIVISYLISRYIQWTDIEKNIIDSIIHELKYNNNSNYKPLKFSVAYYFVKSCRPIIRPNDGFMAQLQKYELLHHDGVSTRNDIDYYYDITDLVKYNELNNNPRSCNCVIL